MTPLKPLPRYLKVFQIWLQIRGEINHIVYYTELQLPASFTAGSHICVNYVQKLWSTIIQRVNKYSPYCAIQRFITPHIVYRGELLLPVGGHSWKCWRTPLAFKGTVKQKSNMHVEHWAPGKFYYCQKYELPKAPFLLSSASLSAGSQFFDRINTNTPPKLNKIQNRF